MSSGAAIDKRKSEDRSAEQLLRELAQRTRPAIRARDVAVVLAHPDDETIGCGAQLPRLRDLTLIIVTDGAPRNLADARAHGFHTATAYAAARRRELLGALALAGVSKRSLVRFGLADQEAAGDLSGFARRLADTLWARGIRHVLTHAYEGGHPDHDATAFAVHAAVAMIARRGRALSVIEMPFYRAGRWGWLMQSFRAVDECPVVKVELGGNERLLKQCMVAAHATQRATLAPFPLDAERFRLSPGYDFARLPNEGCLLYERYDWGMTGARWLAASAAACRDLCLGGSL